MRAQSYYRPVRIFFTISVFIVILTSQALGVSYTVIDLTPIGFDVSNAFGISGTQQVGYGFSTNGKCGTYLWFLERGALE